MATVGQMNASERREHGWDAAVNLITPIPRTRLLQRYLQLRAINSDWIVRLAHQVGATDTEPIDDEIRRLNHLHVARWSLVWRFPRPGRARPEPGRHSLLLFTSHFDFGWKRYLGTFIETTGDGLSTLWGDIPSWRTVGEGSRQFENLVVDQQVPHRHLFSAFPNLSCNDVRSALRISREVESEERKHRVMVDDNRPPERTIRRQLHRRLQHSLVPIPKLYYPDLGAAVEVDRAPRQEGLTCIVPYDHRSEGELADAFRELGYGPDSPFAGLPGTHFARMAMITPEHFHRRSVPPLANGYVLVSAEFDGPVRDWLHALSGCDALYGIWERCHGYTDPGGMADLLLDCRVTPDLEYFDYPGATVAEIASAIATTRRWYQEAEVTAPLAPKPKKKRGGPV